MNHHRWRGSFFVCFPWFSSTPRVSGWWTNSTSTISSGLGTFCRVSFLKNAGKNMEPSQSLFHKFFWQTKLCWLQTIVILYKQILQNGWLITYQEPRNQSVDSSKESAPKLKRWKVSTESQRLPTKTNQTKTNQSKKQTTQTQEINQTNKPTPPTKKSSTNHPPWFFSENQRSTESLPFFGLADSRGRLGVCILMCQVKTSGAIHQAMPIGLLPPEPR